MNARVPDHDDSPAAPPHDRQRDARATTTRGLGQPGPLAQTNEPRISRRRHRSYHRRVACTFLGTPDADARLCRVYQILLRSTAAGADGQEKKAVPAPPGAAHSIYSTTVTTAEPCSRLEEGHGSLF